MAINTEAFVKGTAGAANTLTGDAVVAEVQEIIQGDGIGLYQLFARPNGQNGSTFIYKTPERLVPKGYDRTATGKLSEGGVVGQVEITANTVDWTSFEIEDTEWATQVQADAEKSRLANSIVSSIMTMLDAELLAKLNETTQTASPTNFQKLAPNQGDLALSRLALGDVIAKAEGLIDAKTLGVPAIRQLVILSPVAFWRYINSFGTYSPEQVTELRNGVAVIRINGALVIKHPLIGQDFAAGTLHKTKAYDLSKHGVDTLEGFVVTDIAAAFPITLEKSSTRVNEFGNEEIIVRYKYGKGLIRDKLIVPLVTPKAP